MKNKYIKEGNVTILLITQRNGNKHRVLIDTEDLPRVLSRRWCMQISRNKYVVSNTNNKRIYLHHFLIGHPGVNMETDHRDRNSLNNCKKNLAHVSLGENKVNRKVTNKHGFPGLEYIPDYRKKEIIRNKNIPYKPWRTRLRIKNNEDNRTRLISIGVFATKKEAIEARRKAELKYFGSIFH